MHTSLEQERGAQRRWRLRPRYSHLDWFDRVVENEFASPKSLDLWQRRAIARLIPFAASRVPYYRDQFRQHRIPAEEVRGVADLARLPVLGKLDLHRHGLRLQAPDLSAVDRAVTHTHSSGTTGRPVRVALSGRAALWFALLRQRQTRWFRFDPCATIANIRIARRLRGPDGKDNPDGATHRLSAWANLGRFFETGEEIGFNDSNPLPRQMDWLAQHRPRYLIAYPETLEILAFSCREALPLESLDGVWATSAQLTAAMRRRVEQAFMVPIHQQYGLAEIGMVAVRCTAGRYHVHSELCHVEILDDDDRPCAPGEIGRLVVTGWQNLAMPLIRYDTEDLAEVTDGPCPCGRTLPSFGDISGRYRRSAFLPEGTARCFRAVRDALEEMPDPIAEPLRQYQLHQHRDNRFELRLLTAGPLSAQFTDAVRRAWDAATAGRRVELEIRRVESIERGKAGKKLEFTSDFLPGHGASPEAEVARLAPESQP